MDDRTGKNALKDFSVQRVVTLCNIALIPIRTRIGKRQGTYVPEYSLHSEQVNPAGHIGVGAPAHQCVPKPITLRSFVFGPEMVATSTATIIPTDDSSDPFFHSTLKKLQVEQFRYNRIAFLNCPAVALRARAFLIRHNEVRAIICTFQLPTGFADHPKFWVGAYEDFVALVIEIRVLCDRVKVFGCIFPRP